MRAIFVFICVCCGCSLFRVSAAPVHSSSSPPSATDAIDGAIYATGGAIAVAIFAWLRARKKKLP